MASRIGESALSCLLKKGLFVDSPIVVVTPDLSPRFLGTAEHIFHVRARVGCHIGGKGRPSMC
ncbi:MAG: hypothetical protein IK005_12715 [Paludibacteraceae bacterium]|nr:hypothetical protein [Paludibacteraceae bacterium]